MLVTGERKRTGMRVAWRKRLRAQSAMVVAVAAAGLALASCAPTAPAGGKGTASWSGGVISLTTIATLRTLFNRDSGHPRLVLIATAWTGDGLIRHARAVGRYMGWASAVLLWLAGAYIVYYWLTAIRLF